MVVLLLVASGAPLLCKRERSNQPLWIESGVVIGRTPHRPKSSQMLYQWRLIRFRSASSHMSLIGSTCGEENESNKAVAVRRIILLPFPLATGIEVVPC